MWEAIRANERRSWLLVSLMGAILVLLGFAIGFGVFPEAGGGAWGTAIALGVWLALWMVALLGGDQILLATAGAKRIEHRDHPQLHNIVEEMKIASGLEAMPGVYVVPDESPNAFAIGRKPQRSAVAVTAGLLRILNRDELQGVIAHEIGHLRNRDTKFMMLVGVMLGAIVLISDLFLRTMRFGPRRRSSSREGGGAQAVFLLVAVLVAVLAPLVAQIIYFACSRRREYLADASGARFTRYPEGLASALEKISVYHTRRAEVNRVLAPMYIVNPMSALAAVGLFSTHPPTADRVRILRAMAGGAGYADYEAAFKRIAGRSVIGGRTLASEPGPVALRAASAPETSEERTGRSREVVDFLGRLDNLLLMTCACGVGIRIPSGLKRDAVPCPRCGRENRVPHAEPASAEPAGPSQAFKYRRRGQGWESFQCPCGATVQLSPAFGAPVVVCSRCDRKIQVLT